MRKINSLRPLEKEQIRLKTGEELQNKLQIAPSRSRDHEDLAKTSQQESTSIRQIRYALTLQWYKIYDIKCVHGDQNTSGGSATSVYNSVTKTKSQKLTQACGTARDIKHSIKEPGCFCSAQAIV